MVHVRAVWIRSTFVKKEAHHVQTVFDGPICREIKRCIVDNVVTWANNIDVGNSFGPAQHLLDSLHTCHKMKDM